MKTSTQRCMNSLARMSDLSFRKAMKSKKVDPTFQIPLWVWIGWIREKPVRRWPRDLLYTLLRRLRVATVYLQPLPPTQTRPPSTRTMFRRRCGSGSSASIKSSEVRSSMSCCAFVCVFKSAHDTSSKMQRSRSLEVEETASRWSNRACSLAVRPHPCGWVRLLSITTTICLLVLLLLAPTHVKSLACLPFATFRLPDVCHSGAASVARRCRCPDGRCPALQNFHRHVSLPLVRMPSASQRYRMREQEPAPTATQCLFDRPC